MKKSIIMLLIFSISLIAQLNGTKTIDPSGSGPDNYTSFSAAISALNSNGTTSGVTFRIASGTYTEASPLLINITTNKPSADAKVTFKPAEGATCILNIGGQVTGTRYGIAIGTTSNSVDYVILDGSNSTGGTSRDWTIKATAATYGIETIDIYGDYCQVLNCIIDMNSSGYSGSGFGITLRDAAPTATNATIQNNKVTGNNAISIGRGTTNDMPGCLIKGNEVHSLNRGIYAYRSSNIIIESNEIIGDAFAGYPTNACYGIYVASPSGNTGEIYIRNNIVRNLGSNSGTVAAQTIRGIAPSASGTYYIYNNKVYNLNNATTSTGTPIVYGLQLAGGGSTSIYYVYNNMISGLNNNDPDASSSTYTYGIQYNTSGNAYIYYNSVYIEDTGRDHLCAALQLTAGNAANNIYIANNILVNLNTSSTYKSYAVYKSPSLVSILNSSNYNDLYVATATNLFVGYDGTTDRSTLADWQTTGFDANSKSKAVNFVSSTDLHLTGGSIADMDLAGTPLGAPYDLDIDGDTRNASKPYMGADEGSTPLPVELTSFTVNTQKNAVVLNWTTATETQNYGWEIQRKKVTSEEGTSENWVKIGFVKGSGNSNSPKEYSYIDNSFINGEYVYRLKQIDLDGGVNYSENVKITIGGKPKEVNLHPNYPNPFNPTTKIRYEIPKDGKVSLVIYNAIGEQVAVLVDEYQTAGYYEKSFNASQLSSGVYIYILQTGDVKMNRKMLLVK